MNESYEAAIEIREAIVELQRSQADAKERRRYALLQATATYIAQQGTIHESSTLDRCGPTRIIKEEIQSAVSVATALLAEIEKREARS